MWAIIHPCRRLCALTGGRLNLITIQIGAQMRGDVLRNGARIGLQDAIAAGDRLETGPGSRAVLTVGDSAFLVRENTHLALEGESPVAVRALRLLHGAVASVWSLSLIPL